MPDRWLSTELSTLWLQLILNGSVNWLLDTQSVEWHCYTVPS
jgi:hypothetical protein